MGLETATYVANLITSNPDGGDARSTGDDHLRLIKAALVRTFPKLDAAVSLSAVQYMYLNDLSASVQLQLNQLRDGSATANNAVNARFANSASMAANIGSIPAARVPDLAATNVFSAAEAIRLQNSAPLLSFYKASGLTRMGYVQLQDGTGLILSNEQNGPIYLYTNSVLRVTIGADGTVVIPGAITGTISNATTADNATTATTATNAANATIAAFATSAGSAALLSGLAPSDTVGNNTIAQRNSSGELFASYFNQGSNNNETIAVSQFVVTDGSDYFRKTSAANAGIYISGQNISGRSGTTKTLSSSAPTGGFNGDIWYQYGFILGLIQCLHYFSGVFEHAKGLLV